MAACRLSRNHFEHSRFGAAQLKVRPSTDGLSGRYARFYIHSATIMASANPRFVVYDGYTLLAVPHCIASWHFALPWPCSGSRREVMKHIHSPSAAGPPGGVPQHGC